MSVVGGGERLIRKSTPGGNTSVEVLRGNVGSWEHGIQVSGGGETME